MIKGVNHLFFHYFFQIAKVYYHPIFDVIFIIDGLSYHRHRQFVTMTVYIAANGLGLGLSRFRESVNHTINVQLNIFDLQESINNLLSLQIDVIDQCFVA